MFGCEYGVALAKHGITTFPEYERAMFCKGKVFVILKSKSFEGAIPSINKTATASAVVLFSVWWFYPYELNCVTMYCRKRLCHFS
jgi:hypothetical protein